MESTSKNMKTTTTEQATHCLTTKSTHDTTCTTNSSLVFNYITLFKTIETLWTVNDPSGT